MRNFLLIINLLVCFVAFAQPTTLDKGDVMVLGVNANNNICDNSSTDIIHLVFLKAINTDTEFLFTDNRWTSSSPPFSRTEGVVLAKRTGSPLPAGSIVTIKMTDLASQNNSDSGNGQSSGWSITKVNNNSGDNNPFALRTDGDQIIIWQGSWNSTSPGNFTGNLLFAYNSKNRWNNTVSSTESRLPNDLICFNSTPYLANPNANQSFPYRYYNGPTTIVSKGEWQVRLMNVNFWSGNFNDCSPYNSSFNLKFPTNSINFKSSEDNIEVCDGESITLSVENHSFVTYQWFRSDTNDTNGNPVNLAINHSYNPNQTGYYYCSMTINIPVNLNGTIVNNSCTYYSNIFSVTVNPNPVTSPVIPL